MSKWADPSSDLGINDHHSDDIQMRNCIGVNLSKSQFYFAGHTTEEADLILNEAGVLHSFLLQIFQLSYFAQFLYCK